MPVTTRRTRPMTFSLMLTLSICLQITGAIPDAVGTDVQWEFIGDNQGVALYRHLKEADGLLPFKAVAELEVPYEKIVMVLVDAERKPDWAPKLKATVIHSQQTSNRFEYSEYYRTPWPFKDREFLLMGTVTYERNRIVFSAVNSENKSLAKKDHVTADIRELTFTVTPLSETRTRVEFTFSGDLGGWIPAFVKTIIQKRWPVRFIQAIQKQVADNGQLDTPRYRSLQKSAPNVPEVSN